MDIVAYMLQFVESIWLFNNKLVHYLLSDADTRCLTSALVSSLKYIGPLHVQEDGWD